MERKTDVKNLKLGASIMLMPFAVALLLGAAYAAIAIAPQVAELGKGTLSTGVATTEFYVDTSPIDVYLMMPGQPIGPTSHNMIVSFGAIAPAQYLPLECHYSLDGGEMVKIPGCAQFALVNLGDGSHEIEIFAESQNGEVDSAKGQFAVNAAGVPYPEPTITKLEALTPYGSDYVVEYVIALAQGTTAEECAYSLDDTAPVQDPTCTGFEIGGLEDGLHTLTVYVTDSGGNSGIAKQGS